MPQLPDHFQTLTPLASNPAYLFYSLPIFAKKQNLSLQRLPFSIRIVLESLLRNCDGKRVQAEQVQELAKWSASQASEADLPFVVARVILQDFTGVPLLVDLAAMRDAVAKAGISPQAIEPDVAVDLIVDHSVQVDSAGSNDAFSFNLEMEFARNHERYSFLKWGQYSHGCTATINLLRTSASGKRQTAVENSLRQEIWQDHDCYCLSITCQYPSLITNLSI